MNSPTSPDHVVALRHDGVAAIAGALAPHEAERDGRRRHRAAGGVAVAGTALLGWAAGVPLERDEPAHLLDGRAEAHAARLRSVVTEGGHLHEDDAGVERAQRVVPQAQPLGDAHAPVLDDHICVGDEPLEGAHPLGVAQVEDEATFVAVVFVEVGGAVVRARVVGAGDAADSVGEAGTFDMDDARTHVRQETGREGPRPDLGEVEHADPVEERQRFLAVREVVPLRLVRLGVELCLDLLRVLAEQRRAPQRRARAVHREWRPRESVAAKNGVVDLVPEAVLAQGRPGQQLVRAGDEPERPAVHLRLLEDLPRRPGRGPLLDGLAQGGSASAVRKVRVSSGRSSSSGRPMHWYTASICRVIAASPTQPSAQGWIPQVARMPLPVRSWSVPRTSAAGPAPSSEAACASWMDRSMWSPMPVRSAA